MTDGRAKERSSGQLRILLLGGFEVWSRGEPLRGFESQKVRALLAWLVLHRGRAFGREQLAALFWGDKDDETARRNLRQALYSLKATLPGDPDARPHLVVDHNQVLFDRHSDYWLDVEAFEHALGPRADVAAAGFHDLVGASRLYRGDLLAGFLLRDCPQFEEWLVTEQERLRELALEALRTLVASYLARGEHRLGIQLARRLVAMDPLSEEAHRHLMRLYEIAGQRDRAFAHYAALRELLRRELNVEPLAETRDLHEKILRDALRVEAAAPPDDTLGPIVPLVGREEAYLRLAADWQAVLDGELRLTLLTGEEGIGKTRLARSFIDAATSHRRATVLTAACGDAFPERPFRLFAQLLEQALADDPVAPERQAARLPAGVRRALARLVPAFGDGRDAVAPGAEEPLDSALAEAFRWLAGGAGDAGGDPGGDPLVVFVDDLQHAGPADLELLARVARRLADAPVWLLVAADGEPWEPPAPLAALGGARLGLERLDDAAMSAIAAALVEPGQVGELQQLLATAGEGLPLAIVTLVNAMWDERELVPGPDGSWRFTGATERWALPAQQGLDRLLLARVRRLPTSTRRLLTLAAVIGQRFDSEVLRRAEDEHPAVVETGLQLLLERWLVRPLREQWNPRGLERSLTLWSRGARQGWFQFDHPRLRALLYRELNPLRRQVLHRQVAAALAALHAADTAPVAEAIAHHALAAGAWELAYPWLGRAAERARAAGDEAGAARCESGALQALERLAQEADGDAAQRRWQQERERFARPEPPSDSG